MRTVRSNDNGVARVLRRAPRRLRAGSAVLGAVTTALIVAAPAPAVDEFTATGSMATERASHTMTVLGSGLVLIAGGGGGTPFAPAAELYDARVGAFSPAPGMTPRTGHTASLLDDRKVLIAGGHAGETATATSELYDADAGAFAPTGSMTTARAFGSATVLADGRVLVAGGHRFNFPNSAQASAELYDPVMALFTPTGSMNGPRQSHSATRLLDGRVLIMGGYDASQLGLTTAELYDPLTGSFTPTGTLRTGRGDHTATLLPDGRVLIAGGFTGFPGSGIASTEIFDPGTESFASGPALSEPRGSHTASSLPDGRVLIAGGFTAFPFLGSTLGTSEVFDPTSALLTPGPAMVEPRGRHAAVALASGRVLLTGGLPLFCCSALRSAELFSVGVDETPPVITVPGGISADATGPDGAVVVFQASATDDVDGPVPISCVPPSGSTFPIGTTTVTCTASDTSGNQASATFHVTVTGASEQLAALLTLVEAAAPGTSLASQLIATQAALARNDAGAACRLLTAFANEVRAQSGKKLSPAQASELITSATRIQDIVGCEAPADITARLSSSTKGRP